MQEYVLFDEVYVARDGAIQAIIDEKIAALQHKIRVLQGPTMLKYRRQYQKYVKWYISLAKTGKYSDDQLDKLDDKICDLREGMLSVLGIDSYHFPNEDVVEIAIPTGRVGADCQPNPKCLYCSIHCPNQGQKF